MKEKKVDEIIDISKQLILDKFPEYASKTSLLRACLNGFIYAQELNNNTKRIK